MRGGRFLTSFIFGVMLVGFVFAAGLGANADVGVNAGNKVEIKSNSNAQYNESGEGDFSVNGEKIMVQKGSSIQLQEHSRVMLSNGENFSINVTPGQARVRAQERLNLSCDNCTLELKEVKSQNGTRVAYEVQAEKQARVLGLFRAKVRVSADVDAETGEVLDTKKPWWAVFAVESKAKASLNDSE